MRTNARFLLKHPKPSAAALLRRKKLRQIAAVARKKPLMGSIKA